VRSVYLPLSLVCLLASFLLLPVVKAGGRNAGIEKNVAVRVETAATSAESLANSLYDSLNLDRLGMSRPALKYALRGFQKLKAAGAIENPDILTVCDFSQRSDKKRFYILDLRSWKVLVNTYVAHGKNSGLQYAKKFSNRPESLQSSLGFYVTKHTYFGKHGLSLRLAGKDRGYNDKAEARAVVLHGADYIGDNRLGAPYMGRSFGCPAVPSRLSAKVISLIKDGTCMFIYHPTQRYLQGSTILNG